MSVNQLPVQNNNVVSVLQQTLYPEATTQEAEMIISYCRARKIDPMLKPVHLVPMNVKTNRKDPQGKSIYEYRNVIMPGIALYRIDASRTGQYAGMSEPEFGEDVTEQIGMKKITYPKWCKITVNKLMNGQVYQFSAKEYWKENYATKSRTDNSPNDVWTKRAYGQLAKCAEAQVLRKAFPEAVPHEYTKEEMEGKTFPDHKPILNYANIVQDKVTQISPAIINDNTVDDLQLLFVDYLYEIKNADSLEKLKSIYDEVKAKNFHREPELFKKLVLAKDERKLYFDHINAEKNMLSQLDAVNVETGEVLS
jgi:phage recombination protein Bet